MLNLAPRPYRQSTVQALRRAGLLPLLARLLAARGIEAAESMKSKLAELLPVGELKNAGAAACRLADAIARGERLRVVADYDADGATACAVAVAGLAALGGKVDYLVPSRFEYGYGLSPEIARLAAEGRPDLLITVDNGIAAHAGVEEARQIGRAHV
jgi:single-stranded-DNA-specific exonuclease